MSLRGAIIGCGRVVQDRHVSAWQTLGRETVSEWTLADPSLHSRAAVQIQLGVPNEHAYKDYRALLIREQPDFAVVCSPHAYHETTVMDCLNAGVAVLVEKPIATCLASSTRMARKADESGVILSVIHNYLFMEQIEQAHRLLVEDRLGKPFLFRSEWIGMGWTPGAEGYLQDWRVDPEIAGGGCLLDNGYHSVYLAQAFLGPVASVMAHVGTRTRDIAVDDTALLLLEHESGASTSIQVAWSAGGQSTHVNELYGKDATLRMYPGGDLGLSRGDEWERRAVPGDDGFVRLFRQFTAAVRGESPVPVSGWEAVETMRVIRAAYASAERRQAVDVRTCQD